MYMTLIGVHEMHGQMHLQLRSCLSSPDHQVETLWLELCCFVCVIRPQLAELVEHLPSTQYVAGWSPA